MLATNHSHNSHHNYGRLLAGKILLVALLCYSLSGWTAELIMIEQDSCPYCMVFDKEILPDYAASEEGKLAPLRRVNLTNEWPSDLSNIKKDRLTPTFVLVEDNIEYGRLRGYPGQEHFWMLLKKMLAELPKQD